jgi:ribosomal protein S18
MAEDLNLDLRRIQEVPQPSNDRVNIGETSEPTEITQEQEINPEQLDLNNLTNAMLASIKSSLLATYSKECEGVEFPVNDSFDTSVITNTDINANFETLFDSTYLESILDLTYNQEAMIAYHAMTNDALDYLHKLTFFRIAVYQISTKFKKPNIPTLIQNIEQFYTKVKSKVESLQKKLSIYSQPLNGHTIGYPKNIALSNEYITQAFRINSDIHSGFVSTVGESDNSNSTETNQQIDTSLHAEVSRTKNNVFVMAGPNTIGNSSFTKIDSLAYFSIKAVPEETVSRLISLVTELVQLSLRDSVINYSLELDSTPTLEYSDIPELTNLANSIKHDQLQAKTLTNLIEEDQQQLSAQIMLAQRLETTIAKPNIDILQKAKLTLELKGIHETTLSISQTLIQLKSNLDFLQTNILDNLNTYNQLMKESNSDHQSLQLPSSNDYAKVFKNGFPYFTPPPSTPNSKESITSEINHILIENSIYVNSFQTQPDANTPSLINSTMSGQYSGIIGAKPDRTADITTTEESLNCFFNQIDPEIFYPDQLPLGTSRRINN